VKPVTPRSAAETDINTAFDYYWAQGRHALAERFLDAYDAALLHVARHPGTGSPRHAAICNSPGLRFWALQRFPFVVFYIEQPEHIAVLRVLHQAADLPSHLN